MVKSRRKRVVIIGDIHFPWVHRRSLDSIYKEVRETPPDVIIQAGDLHDFYSYSRYPTNPNVTTPEKEIERGYSGAEEMWKVLGKLAPKARRVQLLGNHDDRPSKRLSESLPAVKVIAQRGLAGLFTFDGVETVLDSTEEFFLDGVVYMHGHRSKLGDHARYNQQSTVCGHSHHGGVVYLRQRDRIFFEMNVGWIGDESAPVFRYGNQKILKTWTRGFGIIDAQGPRFVAL